MSSGANSVKFYAQLKNGKRISLTEFIQYSNSDSCRNIMRNIGISDSSRVIPNGQRLQICVLEDNEVVGELIGEERLMFYQGSKKLELLIRLKKIAQVKEIDGAI